MKCLTSEDIQKYLDDELSKIEKSDFDNHINACKKCSLKFEQRKALLAKVKQAINSSVGNDFEIPPFSYPEKRNIKKLMNTGKKVFYVVSAACILLFVFFMIHSDQNFKTEVLVMHQLNSDFDANKTISQQQMNICIIDANGNVTEFIVD